MKRNLILFALLLMAAQLPAQNRAIDQIFKKYADREGYTSVVITKNMFQLFANVDNPSNDEFLKTVKNLDFIKILSIKGEREGKTLFQDILSALPEKDYKELMTIKETGSQIKFLTLEQNGVIRELIMISNGKEESSMIWLSGIIDMRTVSKIAEKMKIEGMENLGKAGEKK